jgi:hypothetical protein
MRGVDLPETDIKIAAEFLSHITGGEFPDNDQLISISRAKMIRVVAWYAAIRANGDGQGHFVSNGKPLRKPTPKEQQG